MDKFLGEFYSWTAFGGPQKKRLPSIFLTRELVPETQNAKNLSKSILGSKVVEFGLGNYGSGGLLEPLQLSGIYKTTSGLGFNCLFVLKLIHPETYSFSYFFLMKERAQVIPSRVSSLTACRCFAKSCPMPMNKRSIATEEAGGYHTA